ncbi:protein CASPARIAN STRIP INTEGRITY FACTOR 1-like isoform X2 [Hordeum vulgare subsp. vulgare]|uniref:protein CASPARIAN STRIP INTEGRITY FACTOR 1-like isoform X2 n=1 Tax=Hordeum vulgare subsp. vulgare TaxID=112509 RepID=UPI00029589FE|nr:protein CASPARIAN STRIP INTEGRITY FACTOR 1-like isoform X2 [Hordeum vulgare subsp. vulgare]
MEANKPSYYLFVFVCAALLLSSMAGAQRKLLMNEEDAGSTMQEDDEVLVVLHGGRILRQVKTNDYGTYDPTPTMAKPHFKDIPN